ncbi:MAG: DUF2164 family protein, partial [Planctomycetes bacterium]|nr:DUF2164 family protein [Planctomycetota bacterium]
QPLNNLQIQLLIRFMTDRFGSYYYGQGIRDAKEYLLGEFQLISESVKDLENNFNDS